MTQLTPAELEVRRTGIGSSDVAALCGESQWAGPHAIWLDKLGLLESEDSEPAKWGRMMEPLVAQRYTEETGVRLRKGSIAMRHPEHTWALASPDFLREDNGRIVECKCAFRTAAQWSLDEDGAPPGYILQGQWQCGVIGADGFDLAVFLAPFATFRIYRFDFDQDLFAYCLKIAGDFWHNHVLTKIPPPADDSDEARKALAAAYPQRGEIASAPPGADELYRARVEADAAFEAAEKAKKLASNRLVECIAKTGAEAIRGNDWMASWRSDKRGIRSLRLKGFSEKGRAA